DAGWQIIPGATERDALGPTSSNRSAKHNEHHVNQQRPPEAKPATVPMPWIVIAHESLQGVMKAQRPNAAIVPNFGVYAPVPLINASREDAGIKLRAKKGDAVSCAPHPCMEITVSG